MTLCRITFQEQQCAALVDKVSAALGKSVLVGCDEDEPGVLLAVIDSPGYRIYKQPTWDDMLILLQDIIAGIVTLE